MYYQIKYSDRDGRIGQGDNCGAAGKDEVNKKLPRLYQSFVITGLLMDLSRVTSRLWGQRFDIPDHIGVLLNASVTAKEPHPADTGNALADPFVLVLVRLIDQGVCFDVAVEVIADQIVVPMIDDGIAQGRKMTSVAKQTSLDSVKYLLEVFIQLEFAVCVGMAEIFHILGQVAKEENVIFSNLACDLNLLEVSHCGSYCADENSRWLHHRSQ